jgi:hypothetical protein
MVLLSSEVIVLDRQPCFSLRIQTLIITVAASIFIIVIVRRSSIGSAIRTLILGRTTARNMLSRWLHHSLELPEVETTLQTERRAFALIASTKALDNDYRILTDLLSDAAGDNSIELRVLMMHFKMMQIWYGLTKTSRNLPRSRNALSQMSSILGYFAAEIAQSGAF